MDVQEMSLFELALEAVKQYQGSGAPDFDYGSYCVLLDEVAKQMRAHEMRTGAYRWGNCFLDYRIQKNGNPFVDIYDHKTESLMSLPGWAEYKASKGVEAAELVGG